MLYPAIDFRQFDSNEPDNEEVASKLKEIGKNYFFSLNRYERKKNIGLAIESFAQLVKTSADKSQ